MTDRDHKKKSHFVKLYVDIYCLCRTPEFKVKHGLYNVRDVKFVQCSFFNWYHPEWVLLRTA